MPPALPACGAGIVAGTISPTAGVATASAAVGCVEMPMGWEAAAAEAAARASATAGPGGGLWRMPSTSARTWNLEVKVTRARTVAPSRETSKGRRTCDEWRAEARVINMILQQSADRRKKEKRREKEKEQIEKLMGADG